MFNIATIGTSWITEQFIEAVKMNQNFHLRAVYSRSIEKAETLIKKHEGDYASDDLNDFWKDDSLDIVYIASPNSLHFEQAKSAIQAKKHLFVEKPIFSNLDEWEEVFDLAEENDVFVLEASRHIHTKNYHYLKELINYKKNVSKYPFLGANLNMGQYSSRYDKYLEAIKNNQQVPNIFNPEFSGGVLMDLGVYPIYVAIDLFGQPKEVEYKTVNGSNGIDLFGHVYFDYGDFNVVIFISKAVHSQLESEFYFDNETVVVPTITDIDEVNVVTKDKGKVMNLNYEVTNPLEDEVEAFANILLKDDKKTYAYLKNLSRQVTKVMDRLK